MEHETMSFQAYCFRCEKSVTAFPVLGGAELQQALSIDAEIEVMHLSDAGDHQWKLNKLEKSHLLNYLTESSASS
jgi:hypothetical protein